MLSIILTVLKIIGIVLLCILGLVVMILLLVLFVPIRYRIRAKKDESFRFNAGLSWLIHIVSCFLSYDDKLSKGLKIFGIRLKRNDKDDHGLLSNEGSEDEGSGYVLHGFDEGGDEEDKSPAGPDDQKDAAKDASDPDHEPKPKITAYDADDEDINDEGKKRAFFDKLKEFCRAFNGFIVNSRDKCFSLKNDIDKVIKDTERYKNLISDERNKNALSHCLYELVGIFAGLRPVRLRGWLHFGFKDNPETTGEILAILGVLYPLIGPHFKVEPEFEESVLEADLDMKGRFILFALLKSAWRLFFDKDLRRLYKLIKGKDIKS